MSRVFIFISNKRSAGWGDLLFKLLGGKGGEVPVLDIANQVANLEVGNLDFHPQLHVTVIIRLDLRLPLSMLSLSYEMLLSEIQIFLPASKGLIGHTFHFVLF